jgi:hypothetical protein
MLPFIQSYLIFLELISLIHAQSAELPIPCCDANPAAVPPNDRTLWCNANMNTCVDACGGPVRIRSDGNQCNDVGDQLIFSDAPTDYFFRSR